MAISEDRLKISEITGSTVSDFQKMEDAVSNGINNPLAQISNQVEGTINNVMSGFENKSTDILEAVPDPKNLSFNTESLGFFENLLCLKIPSIDFRLPNFKFDIFKDLNFDFNITICRETKTVNPVDAALSIVDKVKDPDTFITDTKRELVNNLLGDNLKRLVGQYGVNQLTDCLLDTSKWETKASNDFLGDSLFDKSSLDDLLDLDGCGGDFVRAAVRHNGLDRITAKSVIREITSTKDTTVSRQVIRQMRAERSSTTSSAVSRILSTEDNSNIAPQIEVIGQEYTTNSDVDFKNIMDNTSVAYSLVNLSLIKEIQPNTPDIEELQMLKVDSSNMFKNLAKSDIDVSKNPDALKHIVLTADLIDKQWNKDEEGNINLYKLKNNPTLDKLAKDYVNNEKLNIDDMLSGETTTNLNIAHHIMLNNLGMKEEFKV